MIPDVGARADAEDVAHELIQGGGGVGDGEEHVPAGGHEDVERGGNGGIVDEFAVEESESPGREADGIGVYVQVEGDLGASQRGCNEDLHSDTSAGDGYVDVEARLDPKNPVAEYCPAVGYEDVVSLRLRHGVSPSLRLDAPLQKINASHQTDMYPGNVESGRDRGRQFSYVSLVGHARDDDFLDADKSEKWPQKVVLAW